MAKNEDQIKALVDAMEQLLDDMGKYGTAVCLAAKAQARVAIEPWMGDFIEEPRDFEMYAESWMSLADAEKLLADIDEAYIRPSKAVT